MALGAAGVRRVWAGDGLQRAAYRGGALCAASTQLVRAQGDGGGGDNWSYKTCKASVKSSSLTDQHPAVYNQVGALGVLASER